MRARRYGSDDRLDESEILQTSRATVPLYDFLHRAAEVDVDELRLEYVGDEPCGFAHCHGSGAKDLNPNRPLIAAKPQLVERRCILAANAFGREEFSGHYVGTKPAADSSERRL